MLLQDLPPNNICGGQLSKINFGESASKFANGEVVLSIRSLLKRYQIVSDSIGATPAPAAGVQVAILPWAFYTQNNTTFAPSNFLNTFLPLYRFYNGGMRFIIAAVGTQSYTGPAGIIHYLPSLPTLAEAVSGLVTGVVGIDNTSYGTKSPLGAWIYRETLTGPNIAVTSQVAARAPRTASIIYHGSWGAEIEVPYYTRWPIMIRSQIDLVEDPNAVTYTDQVLDGSAPEGVIHFHTIGTSSNFFMMRAVADDFSMSFLLGAPICRYTFQYGAR